MDFDRDRNHEGMFQDGPRIRFLNEPDEAAKAWWRARFLGPHGLNPEEVGRTISACWGGDSEITALVLDGRARRFGMRVKSGRFDCCFWFNDRVLDMSGPTLNTERMLIDDRHGGRALGRQFIPEVVELARHLGLERVRNDAEQIGRYAWLRIGFVPDRGSWHRLQVEIGARLAQARPDLGEARFAEVYEMVMSPFPETARLLASLDDEVGSQELFGPLGSPLAVPLGRALLLEIDAKWSGEFALGDVVAEGLLRQYARA